MKPLWLAGAFVALLSGAASAASITSVSLAVGEVLHVTVTDQSGNVVAPACITWSPLGTPAITSGIADATGFSFTGLASGSVTATATYLVSATCDKAPANVSATLPFTVAAAITTLKFTSP